MIRETITTYKIPEVVGVDVVGLVVVGTLVVGEYVVGLFVVGTICYVFILYWQTQCRYEI